MTNESVNSAIDSDPRNPGETGPDGAPGDTGPINLVDLDQTALNESSLTDDPSRQSLDVDSVDADIAESFARDVGDPTDTSTAFLPTDAGDISEP